MAVIATEHHRDECGVLAREFGSTRLEGCVEHICIMDAGGKAIVGEAACREHLDVGRCKDDGLVDAKGSIELANIAVGEDIASDDDRLEELPDFFFACDARFQGGHDVPFHKGMPLVTA